jgi:two-component sensor histidine kinase
LVSNALKHAFPDGRKGEIHIEFCVHNGHQATLMVGDNGVGLSKDLDLGNATSLGLQLVVPLIRQLDGAVERAQGRHRVQNHARSLIDREIVP